jgi:hypothetical protein
MMQCCYGSYQWCNTHRRSLGKRPQEQSVDAMEAGATLALHTSRRASRHAPAGTMAESVADIVEIARR